jgi:hypothetical protein
MYGRKCVGFTVDENELKIVAEIVGFTDDESERHDLVSVFSRAKTDSMGRSTIIYFPNIEWPVDGNGNPLPDYDEEDEEGDEEDYE